MKKPIVSIIIPVYKTEQYLHDCMDSVFKQDYPCMEIVLVDDGSPDSCPAMCDKYAAQYEQVKVVHQTNHGLGFSRNSGVEASSGKYIFFLDSDDCLDSQTSISLLVAQAEKKKADIVVGSFRRFNENMVSGVNVHHLQDGDYTKTVDFRFKGFYMYGHLAYDWGKMYRRSFLEEYGLKCRFYPFTQDKAHNMACCACQPVYAFIDESVYLYRINEASITYRYKEDFIPVWISIASDFHRFLEDRGIKNSYGDLMAFHIFFGSFFLVKQELQYKKYGVIESVKMLKKYNENPYVNKSMKALAQGKYVDNIHVFSWKFVIRAASAVFSLHLYWPYAAGIALLRKLRIDGQITKSRYQNKMHHSRVEKEVILLKQSENINKK